MEGTTRVRSQGSVGTAFAVALWIGLLAGPARADGGSKERTLLTGDWGGARTTLAAHGVDVFARYTAGFWSNVQGGLDTGTRYEGFAQWGVEADLERLVRWKGGGFAINWYSYHGGQPSTDLVGLFGTQYLSGWETVDSVRFFEIYLQQTWANGRFHLKAGQLSADTDFFTSEHTRDLLNASFGFLGLGRFDAPFFPLAAPGLYGRAQTPDGRWEVHAGIYTADIGPDDEDNFGFGYSFDDGASVLAELRARRRPFGRQGFYGFGLVMTSARFEDYESGDEKRGAYGFFGFVDQTVVAADGGRPEVGVFLRAYGTPLVARTETNWYVDAGVRVAGPWPGRSSDVLALGFAYLRFSDAYVDASRASGLAVSRRESLLELTYGCAVTPWLWIQPNLQLAFDPHFGRRDATVVGLRVVIEL